MWCPESMRKRRAAPCFHFDMHCTTHVCLHTLTIILRPARRRSANTSTATNTSSPAQSAQSAQSAQCRCGICPLCATCPGVWRNLMMHWRMTVNPATVTNRNSITINFIAVGQHGQFVSSQVTMIDKWTIHHFVCSQQFSLSSQSCRKTPDRFSRTDRFCTFACTALHCAACFCPHLLPLLAALALEHLLAGQIFPAVWRRNQLTACGGALTLQ